MSPAVASPQQTKAVLLLMFSTVGIKDRDLFLFVLGFFFCGKLQNKQMNKAF